MSGSHARVRFGLDGPPPTRTRTCGCSAGILINRETYTIERCDECALFATDDDAMAAMDALLTLLGDVYESLTATWRPSRVLGETVADAYDSMEHAVRGSTASAGSTAARRDQAAWSRRRAPARPPINLRLASDANLVAGACSVYAS